MLLPMQITVAHIGSAAKDGYEALVLGYLERCSKFAQCVALAFRTEKAMLEWLDRQRGRTPAVMVMLECPWSRHVPSPPFAFRTS